MSPKPLRPLFAEGANLAIKEIGEHVSDLERVESLKDDAAKAQASAEQALAADANRIAQQLFAGQKPSKASETSPLRDKAELLTRVAEEAALLPQVREKERMTRVNAALDEMAKAAFKHVADHKEQAAEAVRKSIRVLEALIGPLAAEQIIRDASRKQGAPFLAKIGEDIRRAQERTELRYLNSAACRAAEHLDYVIQEIEK